MRLQLASDLHLERHPQFMLAAAPGADTLVLAGDVGSYQAGSRLNDADEFGPARLPRAPGAPAAVYARQPRVRRAKFTMPMPACGPPANGWDHLAGAQVS
jgi:hypothetical protein